jgi:hypothetical protein
MPLVVKHLPTKVLETTVESLRVKGFRCEEDTILGFRVVECSKHLNELSNYTYLLFEEKPN